MTRLKELAQHYNSWLVAPFFERAFTESQRILNNCAKEIRAGSINRARKRRFVSPVTTQTDFEDRVSKRLKLAAESWRNEVL